MTVETKRDFWLTTLILAIIILVMALLEIFFLTIGRADAHDYARPELNGWYMSLKSKSRVPCCDGREAIHLSDVDWESHDGHYRVKLNGEWQDVSDDAVVEDPNQDGRTLVWPMFKDGKMVPRCFMPGAMI